MFDHYLQKWQLQPDGEAIITHSSRLLPVRFKGEAAILKVALVDEEKVGSQLMVWWQGRGAARVLAHDESAIVLERAGGKHSLAAWSREGGDAEATRILCQSVTRLHQPRDNKPPALTPLTLWFGDLFPAAEQHGGFLAECAAIAQALFDKPQDEVVLHGDIHHQNVLDFGEQGWLAIDPKGLWGERGFDYANIFCNPDEDIAADKSLFLSRLDMVIELAGLDRERLLMWLMAWPALSAVWMVADGFKEELDFAVAPFAAEELARV